MKILDKHKTPKQKTQMNIPLYKMISMPVVCPTLKIDILMMEQVFWIGYHKEDKVFYVFHWTRKER